MRQSGQGRLVSWGQEPARFLEKSIPGGGKSGSTGKMRKKTMKSKKKGKSDFILRVMGDKTCLMSLAALCR